MTYSAIELMICCAARRWRMAAPSQSGPAYRAPPPCSLSGRMPRIWSYCSKPAASHRSLPTMPISVGDSRTFYRAVMATSMADVMQFAQRGMIDYTFLGGAQIDAFGNLNSTVIGVHAKPKVRFPGSGGACDLASLCWRTMVVTQQNAKRFVEKLDFLTSPGYLTGPRAREAAGLPRDSGPHRVITDLAVMGYAADSQRMEVLSLHPGVTCDQVRAATGFRLEFANEMTTTEPPTAAELRILREEVDPHRYILGRPC